MNVHGYCQRLVTKDLDQAGRILDPAERARALNRADAQMAKDVPFLPLYQAPVFRAYRSTVHGVTANLFFPIWNAENWWRER